MEIVPQQICVYDTKIKQAAMQVSRSPALSKVRNTKSKQASALAIAAKQLRKVSTMRTWNKTEASLAAGFKAGLEAASRL